MAGVAVPIPLAQLPLELQRIGTDAAKQLRHADARPALVACGVYLGARAKKCFAASVSPDGRAWAPVQFRVRGTGGAKPLRDRGLLMAACAAAATAPGGVYRLTDTTLEQGTNLEYAATHQHGAVIVPTKAKALAIPRTIQAYRAGSPRNFPGKLNVVWPNGKASGWLVERKPKGKTLWHYLLVRSVTIPKREFLGITDADADKLAMIVVTKMVVGPSTGAGTVGPQAT